MLKLSNDVRSPSACLSVIYQLLLLSSAAFPYLHVNASQAQAGTQSGPATAEITVQSPSVRTLPYSCPCPHHHMMTLLHLTSDRHNILCLSVVQLSSVLLPGVRGRRPLGSRGEILENTERAWIGQQRADCLLSRRIV